MIKNPFTNKNINITGKTALKLIDDHKQKHILLPRHTLCQIRAAFKTQKTMVKKGGNDVLTNIQSLPPDVHSKILSLLIKDRYLDNLDNFELRTLISNDTEHYKEWNTAIENRILQLQKKNEELGEQLNKNLFNIETDNIVKDVNLYIKKYFKKDIDQPDTTNPLYLESNIMVKIWEKLWILKNLKIISQASLQRDKTKTIMGPNNNLKILVHQYLNQNNLIKEPYGPKIISEKQQKACVNWLKDTVNISVQNLTNYDLIIKYFNGIPIICKIIFDKIKIPVRPGWCNKDWEEVNAQYKAIDSYWIDQQNNWKI
jgi:hypothetical protein